jgi:hypothetical protein
MTEDRIKDSYKRTVTELPKLNGQVKHQVAPPNVSQSDQQEILVHLLRQMYQMHPPKPPKPDTKDMPWDIKLWQWVSYFFWNVSWKDTYNWFATRLKFRTISKYPIFRQWIRYMLSPRVSKEMREKRDSVCSNCEYLSDELTHCKITNAKNRNHKEAYKCPAQKHDGEYPVYHTLLYGQPKKTGCGGCSRNKSNKGKQATNPQ